MTAPDDGTAAGHSAGTHEAMPNIVPVADHAVLVSFGGEITQATLARIHALDGALSRRAPAGLQEVVPAMTSLLVDFDPLVTDHATITAVVLDSLAVPGVAVAGAHHVIEVCYDHEHAPNLQALADCTGLDAESVVEAHTGATYTVGMYGFAPGYAYLYGTPAAIQQPRHPTPGPVIPAGSVIVAGQQCLVIPIAMSTGWFAIGRTATEMYAAEQAQPFLVDVGDTVTFTRISADELVRRLAEVARSRR